MKLKDCKCHLNSISFRRLELGSNATLPKLPSFQMCQLYQHDSLVCLSGCPFVGIKLVVIMHSKIHVYSQVCAVGTVPSSLETAFMIVPSACLLCMFCFPLFTHLRVAVPFNGSSVLIPFQTGSKQAERPEEKMVFCSFFACSQPV